MPCARLEDAARGSKVTEIPLSIATLAAAGNGSGFADNRTLLLGPSVWLAQLPQEVERSVGRGRPELILGHTIALNPTPDQECHLRRACSTARYAYNRGSHIYRVA
jgi:hypothetical protein